MVILVVLWMSASEALGSELPCADPPRVEPPENPFLWLTDVPAAVDAAAVLNNPAEHFLLNDSGRFIRKLLAIGGLFTHTEHAWDALSKAFDAQTDETIHSLLSKRVVVVWDGIDSSSGSLFQLADAIDTQWTLVCEVEPAYLQRIREHLKPVRRRIEHGHAVYAIEQGRYEIVLLNPQDNDREYQGQGDEGGDGWDGAAIILAPRKGSSLLNYVLASYTIDSDALLDQVKAKGGHSIVHGREELIASIEMGVDWSVAWIAQLDRFLPSQGIPSQGIPAQRQGESAAVVGVISTPERGISLRFATDLKMDLTNDNAPAGLLSAVGRDAIFAVAMSRTPSVFVKNDLFHMISTFKPTKDQTPPNSIRYPMGPGLVLLSKASRTQSYTNSHSTKVPPVALTMLTQLEGADLGDESISVYVDTVMYDLFMSYGQSNVPDYQGKFPRAVRTYIIERYREQNREDTFGSQASWLGDSAKFSWLAGEGTDTPFLIVSLSPRDCEATKELRWIAQAAKSLKSIPGQPRVTGVMTTGFFKPAKAIELLNPSSSIDLAISKFVESVEWNIVRIPLGIGGTISIEFSQGRNLSTLGQD